jgi:hypothetical protein
MQTSTLEELYQALLRPEEPVGQEAWSTFLFNIDLARSFAYLSADETQALLACGSQWTGAGWTTSRASKTLFNLTQIPLVASAVAAYRDAWLFAFSIAYNVDIPGLDLNDRSSEAAFALAAIIQGETPEVVPQSVQAGKAQGAKQGAEAQEEEEDEEVEFDWEESLEELPVDLRCLYKKFSACAGNQKFDIKQFLENIPKYDVLPARAPENNHRGDGKGAADRNLRAQQQNWLHCLRVMCTTDTSTMRRRT